MKTLLPILILLGCSTALAQRRPLPSGPPNRPQPLVEAPSGAVEAEAHEPRIALSIGAGALIGSPSLELDAVVVHHVSAYLGVEAGILPMGVGAQVGARLRTGESLHGAFLDVHLRWSRYTAIVSSKQEDFNPGVMGGWSWLSESGTYVSLGLGVNFLARIETTTFTVRSSGGYIPLPVIGASTSSDISPQLELRLQVGHAF